MIADGPSPGSWTGSAGMAAGWRSFLSAMEEFRGEGVDEYRELDGERVLWLHSWSGRGTTSGLELGQMRAKAASLFHVRRGKVSRLVVYFDRDRALADLGIASPGENIEAAGREVLEALGSQDLPRLIELSDPEVEWHSLFAGLGAGGVYRGHEGTRRYVSDVSEAFDIVRADVDGGLGVATLPCSWAAFITVAEAAASRTNRPRAGCSSFVTESCSVFGRSRSRRRLSKR